jgi:hypothetical protein
VILWVASPPSSICLGGFPESKAPIASPTLVARRDRRLAFCRLRPGGRSPVHTTPAVPRSVRDAIPDGGRSTWPPLASLRAAPGTLGLRSRPSEPSCRLVALAKGAAGDGELSPCLRLEDVENPARSLELDAGCSVLAALGLEATNVKADLVAESVW